MGFKGIVRSHFLARATEVADTVGGWTKVSDADAAGIWIICAGMTVTEVPDTA